MRFALVLIFSLFLASPVIAQGILADRINQIIIQGQFKTPEPGFLIVFSVKPIEDSDAKLITSVSEQAIENLENRNDLLGIRLYGKPATRPNRYDYFFGNIHDTDRPWNDGTEFSTERWQEFSADIWDNICILALPNDDNQTAGRISDVTIRRGGKILFDSRAKASYPNKNKINVALIPFTITPRNGQYPMLNLANRMSSFRNKYYELWNDPILELAYADLGQTDKRKYANRGRNWCSEFTSSVYRQFDFVTPDPNKSDVHWKNMREYFEKHGEVYSLREIATWSNKEKLKKIRPGSFISMRFGENTHSLIFTTWVVDGNKPITQFASLSGNNKAMVWAHAPISIHKADYVKGLNKKQLAEYDQQAYIGVLKASQ